MEKTKRIQWIDCAKGICMLSVIAGHLGVGWIGKIVYAYHLTVFFILSGYTMKVDWSKEGISKRFKSLMTPYFITCTAVIVMDIFNLLVLEKQNSINVIAEKISYNLLRCFMASGTITTLGNIDIGGRIGAIWFLPAMFFASVVAQFVLHKISNKKERYIIVVLLSVISYISADFIWLPFSIQSGIFVAPFLVLGYELKVNRRLETLRFKDSILFFVVFILGIITKKTEIYYVTNYMPDLILSTIYAITSSLCIIYISQKLNGRVADFFAKIGRNSIYFLCIHLFELETLGRYIEKIIDIMKLQYTAYSRFAIEVMFAFVGTYVILFIKQVSVRFYENVKSSLSTKRDLALDMEKAILIILMLLGHFQLEERLRTIIYSFHMPAFVFLSGFCFKKESCNNLKITILKQVKSLLLPYMGFAIAYIMLTHEGLLIELKQILFGMSFSNKLFQDIGSIGPVYFVLLLFLTKICYLIIEKIVDDRYKIFVVLGVSLFGYYLGNRGYWLPWSMDCSLYCIIFYYLGHCFKKYNIMEYLCKSNYMYFVFSCIWAYMVYSGGMEIAVRNYGKYGITILGAVSATILLYMLCKYFCLIKNEKVIRIFCKIGENTLYILFVHKLFDVYIGRVLGRFFVMDSIFYVAMMVIFQIIMGIVVGNIVSYSISVVKNK